MPKRGSPNFARRLRLAAELRRLREEAGLTGENVRDQLGWSSSSKLSRIENGHSGVKQPDLVSLLDLYGVAQDLRADLAALAQESQQAGLALAPDASESGEQRRLADAERDAASIWIWEPQIMPGLFQIAAYTRALLGQWDDMFRLPSSGAEQRIQARLLRQDVLSREPPPQIWVVIDESVLFRCIGDPSVMREQLDHLAAVAELAAVEVRIVPLGGQHVIGTGAFNYIKFRRIHAVPQDDLVAYEHLTGTTYEDSEDRVHQYAVAFRALRASALSPADSRSLITNAATEKWAADT